MLSRPNPAHCSSVLAPPGEPWWCVASLAFILVSWCLVCGRGSPRSDVAVCFVEVFVPKLTALHVVVVNQCTCWLALWLALWLHGHRFPFLQKFNICGGDEAPVWLLATTAKVAKVVRTGMSWRCCVQSGACRG